MRVLEGFSENLKNKKEIIVDKLKGADNQTRQSKIRLCEQVINGLGLRIAQEIQDPIRLNNVRRGIFECRWEEVISKDIKELHPPVISQRGDKLRIYQREYAEQSLDPSLPKTVPSQK